MVTGKYQTLKNRETLLENSIESKEYQMERFSCYITFDSTKLLSQNIFTISSHLHKKDRTISEQVFDIFFFLT